MNYLDHTLHYGPLLSASLKAVAAKAKDTDNALVKINTAIPLLSLLVFVFAAGKLVTDVSHIRELMEMRNRFEDARYNTLENRVQKVEAWINIPSPSFRDGQPRSER